MNEDKDLLIKAARHAVKTNCSLGRFSTLARRAWFKETARANLRWQQKEARRVAAFTSKQGTVA
jgi:hypothetical protein